MTQGHFLRGSEKGTATVELALLLPLLLLLFAIAFTGWDAMHTSIGLTSAARAAAITAAHDYQTAGQSGNACTDAANAVNAEENTNVYACRGAGVNNSVVVVSTTDVIDANVSVNLITVTISHVVKTDIPAVADVHLQAHATATWR